MKLDTRKNARKRKVISGEYSATEYTIYLDGAEIYKAGNSPFDSQGYVGADDGVGERTMAAYCESTAQDLVREHGAIFGGVAKADPTE